MNTCDVWRIWIHMITRLACIHSHMTTHMRYICTRHIWRDTYEYVCESYVYENEPYVPYEWESYVSYIHDTCDAHTHNPCDSHAHGIRIRIHMCHVILVMYIWRDTCEYVWEAYVSCTYVTHMCNIHITHMTWHMWICMRIICVKYTWHIWFIYVYGVATISRLLKIISLFCRISSLL